MNWHPYEISFKPSPRARKRVSLVRFGETMEKCLANSREMLDHEYRGHCAVMIQPAGDEVEARVHGVLRGGRVFARRFYYHAPRPQVAERGTFAVEHRY